jgi:hypothetical protein
MTAVVRGFSYGFSVRTSVDEQAVSSALYRVRVDADGTTGPGVPAETQNAPPFMRARY